MFIAHTAYTDILSPRGATGALWLNHRLDPFNRKHRLKKHDATAPLNP